MTPISSEFIEDWNREYVKLGNECQGMIASRHEMLSIKYLRLIVRILLTIARHLS